MARPTRPKSRRGMTAQQGKTAAAAAPPEIILQALGQFGQPAPEEGLKEETERLRRLIESIREQRPEKGQNGDIPVEPPDWVKDALK